MRPTRVPCHMREPSSGACHTCDHIQRVSCSAFPVHQPPLSLSACSIPPPPPPHLSPMLAPFFVSLSHTSLSPFPPLHPLSPCQSVIADEVGEAVSDPLPPLLPRVYPHEVQSPQQGGSINQTKEVVGSSSVIEDSVKFMQDRICITKICE